MKKPTKFLIPGRGLPTNQMNTDMPCGSKTRHVSHAVLQPFLFVYLFLSCFSTILIPAADWSILVLYWTEGGF